MVPEHLTDDFDCIEPDGSRLNKEEFLESNKTLPDTLDYQLEQVDVAAIVKNDAEAVGAFLADDLHLRWRGP